MNDVVTTADLCRLLGVSRETLSKLAKRNIIKRGEKRGTYALQASVSGYSAHLRAEAAGRGGSTGADVRARLGAAQAALTETKARQLAGELVEARSRRYGRASCAPSATGSCASRAAYAC